MKMEKEVALQKLLIQPKKDETKSIPSHFVQDVDSDKKANAIDEGPTLMELMIKAQLEANQLSSKQNNQNTTQNINEVNTVAKKSGFKKGFLSGNSKDKPPAQKKIDNKLQKKSNLTDLIGKPSVGNEKPSLLLDEVQQAMNDDQHPLLKELNKQEWVTPALLKQFQSNAVLSKGFQNPQCMKALELMQKNPQDAMKQFQSNEIVSQFLKAFAELMANHFSGLGAKGSGPEASKGKEEDTLGPLHREVLQRYEKEQNEVKDNKKGELNIEKEDRVEELDSSSSIIIPSKIPPKGSKKNLIQEVVPTTTATATTTATTTATSNTTAVGDDQVQKILQDSELRDLLMDKEMQKILMECGDPTKFNQYLQDPIIAKKIKKLYDAGLVGTVK